MGILIAILVLIALVLILIAPSPRRRRADSWRSTAFAHRGLHGNGAAENTPEAFERACRAGFGIEMDVQFSRDSTIVVFHDDDLKRMTGDARRVDEVDLAELQSLALAGGDGHIPRFEDVLKQVNGRVPLLVELKTGRRNAELCRQTSEMLKRYRGKYLVESFNPLMMRWFKKNAPEMLRGQLVGKWTDYLSTLGRPGAFLLSSLALNALSRPDFVAYDVSAEHFPAPHIQRALFHTPLAAWTVRDEETFAACLARGEMPIFENFVPESKSSLGSRE